MKACSKCDTPKSLEEFVKDHRRSDGRASWCLVCNRLYMRTRHQRPDVNAEKKQYYRDHKTHINEQSRQRWAVNKERYGLAAKAWREANREQLLAYFRDRGEAHRTLTDSLKSCPCLDYGRSFPPFVMEFDHVQGEKRFALGAMSNHSQEAIAAELAKCELVCCVCHRIRTAARRTESDNPKVLAFHEWLQPLKDQPCLDCDGVYPSVSMDFDHVRGEKVSGISQMWSWGRDRVLEEIAKCELVCANCHRVRTQTRRSKNEDVEVAA